MPKGIIVIKRMVILEIISLIYRSIHKGCFSCWSQPGDVLNEHITDVVIFKLHTINWHTGKITLTNTVSAAEW